MNKFIKFFQFLIVGVLFPLYSAQSANLTVDSTVDAVDASPGDGTCATADGKCTLRAAIQEANSLASSDEITVPGGTYTLSIAADAGNSTGTGDLNIKTDLTVTGSPDKNNPTIIDANQTDRIFSDLSNSGTIKLANLTLKNGKPATATSSGGAINIQANAINLEIENCILQNNQSAGGGGIYFYSPEGKLTIKQSTISNNIVGEKSNTAGGGIFLAIGALDMQKTNIINNKAGSGGGLHLSFGATITITDSTISGNIAGYSGGGGGGIKISDSNPTVTITGTLIENNESYQSGGGILATSNGKVMINNSTIINNRTKFHGGGIFITNNGSLTVSSSTISTNRADIDENSFGEGGGLYREGGTVVLKNTIISDNISYEGGARDCFGYLTSADYNLIKSAEKCPLTGATDNNILNQDPKLLALADNGGSTKTLALGSGSPAIDKANSGGCKDDLDQELTTDQRGTGFVRSHDGDGDGTARCDIGAFEVICGDSLKNGNEDCDDANANNQDSCLNTCKAASCGDGFVQTGVEECDNAANNSNTVADACRTTCKNPSCGDGAVDTGEGCDDGNNVDADGCQANCALPTCGDGILDAGEQCDNGASNSNTTADTCRTTCVNAACGDGVVDAGEACDDGNATETDACLNTCVQATCGDGFVQSDVEACDAGSANSNSTKDACRTSCVNPKCGDGVVDTGEGCDDGNATQTDACLSTCVQATCGDGFVETGKEACDAGSANSNSTKDACRTSCVNPKCGDGIVDTDEECDDDSDACEDNCTLRISPVETDPEETTEDDTTDAGDGVDDDATDVDDTTVDSTETTDTASGAASGCGLTQSNPSSPPWLILLLIPTIVVCTLRYSFSCRSPISTIDISTI